MESDFDLAFEPGPDPTSGHWAEEWAEYIAACQPELQSICALISQSNELALKAKICEVSPFLLLLRSDPKFSATAKDVDFSEIRTLDAVELPSAVNTICEEPLTDKFIQTYNQVRSLRNKIAHLGQSGKSFHPDEMIEILIFQYIELWKDRAWLYDRVLFASRTRRSFFHDHKYTSARMEVMHELPDALSKFSNSQFRQLFGHSKTTRRYLCHACIEDANTRYADLVMEKCKTAFVDKTGVSVHCEMCGGDFKVARVKCDRLNARAT